jgi:hypothetical protein
MAAPDLMGKTAWLHDQTGNMFSQLNALLNYFDRFISDYSGLEMFRRQVG